MACLLRLCHELCDYSHNVGEPSQHVQLHQESQHDATILEWSLTVLHCPYSVYDPACRGPCWPVTDRPGKDCGSSLCGQRSDPRIGLVSIQMVFCDEGFGSAGDKILPISDRSRPLRDSVRGRFFQRLSNSCRNAGDCRILGPGCQEFLGGGAGRDSRITFYLVLSRQRQLIISCLPGSRVENERPREFHPNRPIQRP